MKIIGAFAPERQSNEDDTEVVCLRDVRAELLTVGGTIVFAVCMLLTVFAVSINRFVSISQTQHVILVALVGLCWIYFFDSITERLRLVDRCVEFRSLFSHHHVVPLEQIEAMLLVSQGFNLERGMETIEFRKRNAKTQTVSLGPCWQRYKLEAFVNAVEEALQEPIS